MVYEGSMNFMMRGDNIQKVMFSKCYDFIGGYIISDE